MVDRLYDVANLQKGYREIIASRCVTKKALVELVMPFANKYNIFDCEALKIARGGMTTYEIMLLMDMHDSIN